MLQLLHYTGWNVSFLYRQSRYTYWKNDQYSMSAEAYVLQKVFFFLLCVDNRLRTNRLIGFVLNVGRSLFFLLHFYPNTLWHAKSPHTS